MPRSSRRRRAAAPAVALALLTVATGCGSSVTTAPGSGPAVVATTTHAADFTRAVGGERVAVHQILRPGADPHDAEPRPSDARAVAEAALVVRAGGEIDRFLDPLLRRGRDGRALVALADAAGAGEEPHWWQDPRAVERATRALAEELGRIDPAGRAQYAARADAYAARLRRLDAAVAACIDRVPRGERRLVTTHDALGAYARRYGIEEIGTVLPARAAEAQPSAADAARLVVRIRRSRVRAVFPETALAPKLEQAIAREAGVRVGRPLWTDSLGAPGSGADTYLAATAANTEALVEGFTGGRERCRPRA